MQLALETISGARGRGDARTLCRPIQAFDNDGAIIHGFLSRVVASIYEVDTTLITAPSRGNANVALARQIAMYLTHVSCGLTLTEVGRQFGRDRTTVAYACEVVEERREDVSFDQMIELLEQSVAILRSNAGQGQ